MPHLLVGTAGHVDHGKTRLIEALTGVDCDRWAIEKERGITIDLGFAHLAVDDFELGFVDVPGHASFLHNALAGLGGIRLVLLLVAADEGVKPQTREHLDICTLLEIPEAVVALSKCDLVDADLRELARSEIESLLATGPYARSPIVPVSSRSGEGVSALQEVLLAKARALATADTPPAGPVRLPVDRAFQLRGRGTIVTGTLLGGGVSAGDSLEALPGNRSARVRAVEVHGRGVARARAGRRTALQLAGIELYTVPRGTQLVTPESLGESSRIAVQLTLLREAPAPITSWIAVRVHHLTSEVQARLRPLAGSLDPGASGPVEIRLAASLPVARGDRLIVRRPSPALTLGGGRILDPLWRHRTGPRRERALEQLGTDAGAVRLWAQEAGESGVDADDVARRFGESAEVSRERLRSLEAEARLLPLVSSPPASQRWIAPEILERLRARASRELSEYFRAHRLAVGVSKAEAAERVLTPRGRRHADFYLGWLARERILELDGDRVDLPGRAPGLDGRESRLLREIEERFRHRGLDPPSPAELRRDIGAKPQIVDGLIGHLLERRRLVRLAGGLILSADAVTEVKRQLRESDTQSLSVADFKERFGLTRKWAIPLLEHLDSTGVTRRIGDRRHIVRG